MWTVEVWNCHFGDRDISQSYDFKLRVSAEFVEKVRRAEFSQQLAQQTMRQVAKRAGHEVSESFELILFGPYGVHQLSHPGGGGCWLQIDGIPNHSDGSLTLSTHNCQTPSQQSLLMAMWTLWAQYIEHS